MEQEIEAKQAVLFPALAEIAGADMEALLIELRQGLEPVALIVAARQPPPKEGEFRCRGFQPEKLNRRVHAPTKRR